MIDTRQTSEVLPVHIYYMLRECFNNLLCANCQPRVTPEGKLACCNDLLPVCTVLCMISMEKASILSLLSCNVILEQCGLEKFTRCWTKFIPSNKTKRKSDYSQCFQAIFHPRPPTYKAPDSTRESDLPHTIFHTSYTQIFCQADCKKMPWLE